jgi:ABC-type sulfate/molybdate transport systems ATPase subunit
MQGRTLFARGLYSRPSARIGYVPQEGALFPHLNVADNIAWGLDGSRQEKYQRVAALMERVSLDGQLATTGRTKFPAASSSAWPGARAGAAAIADAAG